MTNIMNFSYLKINTILKIYASHLKEYTIYMSVTLAICAHAYSDTYTH